MMKRFVIPFLLVASLSYGTIYDALAQGTPHGNAFQCVTEMFNADRHPDSPRLKQLWYLAFAPAVPWMKISLVQNAAPDEKAERYIIERTANGVIHAENANGLIATFDTRSGALALSNGGRVSIRGSCGLLQ
ncbi:hypothetical protein [Paraburkholderia sp. DGU8]|uniref:hypothetical protein n=1 Tax=Paraburkholderia sp. DGU8 TaxID=3161997 RepID=UPI00346745D1